MIIKYLDQNQEILQIFDCWNHETVNSAQNIQLAAKIDPQIGLFLLCKVEFFLELCLFHVCSKLWDAIYLALKWGDDCAPIPDLPQSKYAYWKLNVPKQSNIKI